MESAFSASSAQEIVREAAVRQYELCYRHEGRIVEQERVQAGSDIEAVNLAQTLAIKFKIEVWDAFRFVGRVKKMEAVAAR